MLPEEVRAFIRAVVAEARGSWIDRRAPVEREAVSVSDLRPHTIDLATIAGSSEELDAAGELLWVRRGAGLAYLEIETTAGPLDRIPLETGLRVRRSYRRVRLVADATATGSVEVWTGRGEPPETDRAWEPYFARAAGAGIAETSITLPAGFDYEIDLVSVLLVNSAAAGNRDLRLAAFPPDATGTDHPVGHAHLDAALTASQQGLLVLAFGTAPGARWSDTAVPIIRPAAAATVEQYFTNGAPAWRGRIVTAAAFPNFAATVGAGDGGDQVTMYASGRRRPL